MKPNVEHYTQDLNSFNSFANDGRGACGIKQVDGHIAKRKLARLVKDARSYFDGFDIDWSRYGEPTVIFVDLWANVEWSNLRSGAKIALSGILWDEKSGEILQAGSNHGELTL